MEFQLQHQSFSEYSGLISFRIDWLYLLAVQGTLESSPTPQFKSISSLVLSFLYSPALTPIHDWLSYKNLGFPGGSDGKESACNAGDVGSISRSGRSPGEGNGNPLQYPCLGNPMNRGALGVIVHGAMGRERSLTQLSD